MTSAAPRARMLLVRATARLASPRRCPIPYSDAHDRIAAIAQTPRGAAMVLSFAIFLLAWAAAAALWARLARR